MDHNKKITGQEALMMVRRGVKARECERVAFAHLDFVAAVQIVATT